MIRVIAGLTVRSLAGRRRVLLVGLLGLLPVLIALLVRASGRLTNIDGATAAVVDRLVMRCIERLESIFEFRLFNRLPDGLGLTEEGQRVYRTSQEMERASHSLRAHLDQDLNVRGLVRCSVTEGLGTPGSCRSFFSSIARIRQPSSTCAALWRSGLHPVWMTPA